MTDPRELLNNVDRELFQRLQLWDSDRAHSIVNVLTTGGVVPKLTAALRAVLDRHSPVDPPKQLECAACREDCYYCESVHEWPCPTVLAIEKELS